MTVVSNLELLSAYLDIMVNACRLRQYSRVELLLPGAIYDAENLEVLDSRLVSIVHDLAQYYIGEGNKMRAKDLFQDLIALEGKISTADGCDRGDLEQIAMQQLSNEKGFAAKLTATGAAMIPSLRKWLNGHWADERKSLVQIFRMSPTVETS